MVLAAIGSAISGMGQMAGSAAAGMGKMMFGSGGGGYGVTGGLIGPATQSTAGLLGAAGKFGLGQSISTIGMGLGLISAMGSHGAGVQGLVRLSKSGKKLEKSVFEDTKAKMTGANLALPYVKAYRSTMKGKLKRKAGEQLRESRGLGGVLASRDVQTGTGAKALLASTGANIEAGAAPEIWDSEFVRSERQKGISGAQNILSEQRQVAMLKAGSDFANAEIGQMRGAQQGQALGDMARYLAYMKYPPYRT